MGRKKSRKTSPPRASEPSAAVGAETGASRTESTQRETPSPRRGFLGKLLLVLGGIAFLEYVWIAVEFLRPRRSRHQSDNSALVVAGPVEQFEKGSVTAFQQGRFYLARLEDGGFLALHRKCTHLGCTVPWVPDEGRFVCPCHASAFDIRGVVENPPAPRPLDLFAVRIENGIVKVDTSNPVQRRSFAASQVARV